MNKQPYLTYEEYVDKYRKIVDDFDTFLEFSKKPLPKIIWTNLFKTDPNHIEELLKNNSAILVASRGKIKGIITKADILTIMR